MTRIDRSSYETRRTTLGADKKEIDRTTAAQRVLMVWQLTREAWTFKDGRWDEPRLRRDVGRVIRRRPPDLADIDDLQKE